MIYRVYRQISKELELAYYIEIDVNADPLNAGELAMVQWIIEEKCDGSKTGFSSYFAASNVVEIGPRISIETSFSSNAVSIFHNMGLHTITRVEVTKRHLAIDDTRREALENSLDKMTEQLYKHGISNFHSGILPEPVKIIDVLGRGISALEEANTTMGLGMDAEDLKYYLLLFEELMRRNPTDVELLQLGNGNSEHSRHGFWKGVQLIDGIRQDRTLMEIVQQPLRQLEKIGNASSVVAFRDNSGVIRGTSVEMLLPSNPGRPSTFVRMKKIVHHTGTAETHNHPTAVSPFPGAQTGAGGRIRDNTAVGNGGTIGAGISGYFVANLFIPGYQIPGEVVGKDKLSTYASPLEILIKGSNGITTYVNEFGEPNIQGFTRSGELMVNGERRGARKPILYSAGIGRVFGEHDTKGKPEVGFKIVAIGGPAYPIGVGGGAASSKDAGQSTAQLDFNSVQRGNAEMKNRTNRVIQTCTELGVHSPIKSIHDQGAGGPSNVLTELIEPLGGRINIREIALGDKTMSVMTIWSAEYQERYGVLIKPEQIETFQSICRRENVSCEILGEIDGSGKVVVYDSFDGSIPVDLDLEKILANVPPKNFASTHKHPDPILPPFELPQISVMEMIKAVFAQLSVCSKGFLVHKGDRSVTGLVVRQQCCGIAQIPISDVAVIAQSHFDLVGTASALGEQPLKMLIDPKAGARMSVGEMLTNLASVKVDMGTNRIRCRANWMWAAKLPHEGALLYDAVVAMSDLKIALGIAGDGGKDSLSMSAKVEGETVKTPGSLVVFGYAPVSDVTKNVTPDIKGGENHLVLIDLGLGKNRLGGSALAQSSNQLGNESPDVDDPKLLKNSFLAIQQMVDEGVILSVHDRSDGGLITTVAEMHMASRWGFKLYVSSLKKAPAELFSEELGYVLEVSPQNYPRVQKICGLHKVPLSIIGQTNKWNDTACDILARDTGTSLFERMLTIRDFRQWWEATSHALEKVQMNPECADKEYTSSFDILPNCQTKEFVSPYHLEFTPRDTSREILDMENNPSVAVIRAEGSNGDREMIAACTAAGLSPWDVTMSDLHEGRSSLDHFQGVIFVGGFSYMDVFGSAKGWAGMIRFNSKLREEFDTFYAREDTFSLGVCNGCQLMALLGWVPFKGLSDKVQPRFLHNTSGRFESRWSQVEILPSPSVLLKGMVGSKLGVWVAHGEGRLVYPDLGVRNEVNDQKLASLAYIDPWGNQTEQYPYNPNGSPNGITALCSPDGRHLAMMPHPERCFRLWQWPWMPESWRSLKASPWLQMFQNARTWCIEQQA